MNQQIELIKQFYTCFQRKDYVGMAACYHPEVTFEDPAFKLKGKEVMAMWTMLLTGGTDLQMSFGQVEPNAAQWEAVYTFSMTGKKVHNKIKASFEFKDGKIIKHTDRFDFHKWAGMAFGITGTLLGWTSFFQNKVKQKAAERLKRYIEKNAI